MARGSEHPSAKASPFTRFIGFIVVLCAVVLSGCQTATRPAVTLGQFYPPLPGRPRIQFLTTLRGQRDIEPEPGGFQKFVLGEDEKGLEKIKRPYGMAWDRDSLYVCDSGAGMCVVFDFAMKQYRFFRGAGSLSLRLPINITVGPDSFKYVCDTKVGAVLVFDADDKPVRAIGVSDQMSPSDAALQDGELYVVDVKNSVVRVFDPSSGRPLRQFGSPGSEEGEFFKPTNLAFAPDGSVYVSDTINARVQKLDVKGNVIQVVGSLGLTVGKMIRPKGVAVDRDGRLYVCDAGAETVLIYDAEGRLLMALGKPGRESGDLSLPANVYLSYEGIERFSDYVSPDFKIEYLVFVSNQFGPNKINVYGFGEYLKPVPSEADSEDAAVAAPAGGGPEDEAGEVAPAE